ncbi:MAG: alpha/beta hydrolase [Cyclobacteriaceae bacterium]|nr:alpha/beta hydrolase [Cyclobacteriaceae bacterium]
MKTIRILFFILVCIGLPTGGCQLSEEPIIEHGRSGEDLDLPNSQANSFYHGLDQDRYVIMESTGIKVHYRIIGKGPVTMVFIPGWTNPLGVYEKQFDHFRDKARCIYIDPPGQGLSDAPEDVEYTMGLLADAIYDVVNKEDVDHFIGVGFSFGHSPLTQFEIKHPGTITQLILLDIGITTWPPMTQDIREVIFAQQLAWTPEIKVMLLNQLIPPDTAPEDLKEFGKYFLDYPNWLLANIQYNLHAEEVCQPYPWTIPIMVVYRSMAEAKEAKTRLYFPNCEIHVIGGDQHVMQWAYKETVNQLMDDFIIDRPGRKY